MYFIPKQMSNLAVKLDNLTPVKIRNASTLEVLLENIFLSSSNKILNCYNELKDGYDNEALHQYRVSIRRFKSFINFFKNEINNSERVVINNIIKMLLNPTSKARDFDVIKEEYISPSCGSHPDDDEFRALEDQSKKIQTELHNNTLYQLSSNNYLNLLDELQSWVDQKKWADELTHTQHNALNKKPDKLIKNRIKKRYQKILKNKKDILIYSQKELHKLRINIKELRYIIDDLGFLIKHKKYELKQLKSLQDILGKINDTYVAQRVINDLSKNLALGISRLYIQDQFEDHRNAYFLELVNI